MKLFQIINASRNEVLIDACVLISAIRSLDSNHSACYHFLKNEKRKLLVPSLAWFEFQAAQSRLKREGKKAYREIYLRNARIHGLGKSFVRKTARAGIHELFPELRGADLVYACLAHQRNSPLASCDSHFIKYSPLIEIINPTEI